MADVVIFDADTVIFTPLFGAAVVAVKPGLIRGSGSTALWVKKVCVSGDERAVAVPGCTYVTAQHTIPGVGTLKIDALPPSNIARQTMDSGKPVLLKGGVFRARFEVQVPAKTQPGGGPPLPDPTPVYMGQGSFVSTNHTIKGQ